MTVSELAAAALPERAAHLIFRRPDIAPLDKSIFVRELLIRYGFLKAP